MEASPGGASRSRSPRACAASVGGPPQGRGCSSLQPSRGGPGGMLTEEDDVEIHALAARGWSVSAISRHTGRDRKTVRKYLAAPRGALLGRERAPICLEPFRAYIEARFEDDAHLEATVLHRELVDAGFARSYPTLLRELRRLALRPVCVC